LDGAGLVAAGVAEGVGDGYWVHGDWSFRSGNNMPVKRWIGLDFGSC
jgi:hypothetical protein